MMDYSQLVEKMKSTQCVTVLTGAGVSAESGVPTFRGEAGLWREYRPEQLATPDAFEQDPKLVWEWYQWRRSLIYNVKPNRGHDVLVKMERKFKDFHLITQNVDGLHYLAGNRNLLELHGNIMRHRCVSCQKKAYADMTEKQEALPHCSCGGLYRPDVVWFGEMLDPDVLNQAFDLSSQSDLFFVIGTSAVVQPAASLPLIAKKGGAYVVEINGDPTPITSLVDLSLIGRAGEILPQIWKAYMHRSQE